MKVKKMYWDEKAECMSREDLNELQLKKLQKTVKQAFEKVPYYNKKYTECGVFPEDIETLKDIEKLPFTTKDDLRAAYPFGMFAVDQKEIQHNIDCIHHYPDTHRRAGIPRRSQYRSEYSHSGMKQHR